MYRICPAHDLVFQACFIYKEDVLGAKTWMLVYSDGSPANILKAKPNLDRDKTTQIVADLFPKEELELIEDGNLCFTCPPKYEIVAGYFLGVFVVAAEDFALDYPSKLDQAFLQSKYGGTVILHAMHSVVDWFAFAIWKDGELQRSLSLYPDEGVMEDIGEKQQFELPFWEGKHPVFEPGEEDNDYPFVFHPLDLGEAALNEFFGYVLEGVPEKGSFDPEEFQMMRFKRCKPWWKFW